MALPSANYDITIGGNGFFYAIDDNDPHVRQTNDYKRQQIDTAPDAGENSLSAWWVRDQDRFDRGEGISRYEPAGNRETMFRYASGVGMDPFLQDGVIHNTNNVSAYVTGSGNWYCNTLNDPSQGGQLFWTNPSGQLVRASIFGSSPVTYTGGGSFASKPVFNGTSVYVVDSTVGSIYSGTIGGSALTALWTATGLTASGIAYVKGRIIQWSGNKMWELTTAGGTTSATPTFTAPLTGGTWVTVCEAPDCILAAINAGGTGYVYRIALVEGTTTGSSPTLGAWTQVATLPTGETVNDMLCYLGSFVALATSAGVRVCDLTSNGQISLGPTTISGWAGGLAAADRFILAAVVYPNTSGTTSFVKIDLSTEIYNFQTQSFSTRTQRYAYSIVQQLTGGASGLKPTSAASDIQGLFCIVGLSGVGNTSSGVYGPGGAIANPGAFTTGDIRFNTTENKTFAYLTVVHSTAPGATLTISASTERTASTTVATLTSASPANTTVALPTAIRSTPAQGITFTFTVTGGMSIIDSWAVKALPAPTIQRLIQYPLRLADFEQDRNGLEVGAIDSAWARLQALETLESTGAVTTVVDNTNSETYSGVIQKIQFVRDTPPSRNNRNYGGRVIVTVLKL